MRILLVIHGYPPNYNAGSEVYTQTLAKYLALNHEVHVFSRIENPFQPDYHLRSGVDRDFPEIKLHLINLSRSRDRYRDPQADQIFRQLLEQIQPNLIHIGHLNHLSTSLVEWGRKLQTPMVYTLHDFWLMCPRGQFLQMYGENSTELWPLCDGQDHQKCAQKCYARYFSGAKSETSADLAYWTDWVRRRMEHIREICGFIDLFIAPSQHLLQKFRDEFGLPAHKLTYLDYGFDRSRLAGRKPRNPENQPVTFGYIGTHIAAKGVDLLIKAFGQLQGLAYLNIWGREQAETKALKQLASKLDPEINQRIHWMGEYANINIVSEVFNHCDAIVVPSIWGENSPLVIHEAQQAKVPVITANYGGMAEYVRHQVNGLLFKHRDVDSLAAAMQRFIDRPQEINRLGKRGYLYSADGQVPSIQHHVEILEQIYEQLMPSKSSNHPNQ